MLRTRSTFCLFSAVIFAACGSDDLDDQSGEACRAGESYNPVSGDCIREVEPDDRMIGPPPADDAGSDHVADDVSGDMGFDEPDTAAFDLGGDTSGGPDLGCMTDEDGDGAIAIECGGDDCDDTDPRRRPGAVELCDGIDNDCDGEVNEGLDCSIFAHSNSRLYRVDFFAGTYDDLGATVSNLYDIDTHPDGTMYGIAGSYLYTYDDSSGTWTPAPQPIGFAEVPNGFCIDNDGTAFVTSGVTSTLRTVDLTTGSSTAVGSMSPTRSSGDCVVTKGNVLLMTSSHTNPTDSLVKIDGDTGAPTIIGETDHDAIWGLTAAYNRLFGLTDGGDVVEIDPDTGASTLIHHYPGLSFYGAASTPDR